MKSSNETDNSSNKGANKTAKVKKKTADVAKNKNDMVAEKLRQLSLEDKLDKQLKAWKSAKTCVPLSQYQTHFKPLALGVRKNLWEEGYRYRSRRKQSGHSHFKLEWNALTDRDGLIIRYN